MVCKPDLASFRINKTHVFMAGGYAGAYTLCDATAVNSNTGSEIPSFCNDPEIAPESFIEGVVLNKAWMFNGLAWIELPSMSARRDRPHCSIIQKNDGNVSRSLEIDLNLQSIFFSLGSNLSGWWM